jgi:glycosyltransferase involved in cell wall biosynthesis
VSQRYDVTIVIPTKDRPDRVCHAVSCALGQQGVAAEVVVVDDGSRRPAAADLTDVAVPDRHALVVVRHDVAQGVSHARNLGLALARAPWTGFCDDDDMWAPTKVRDQLDAACISAAGRTDAGWTCSGTMKVDEQLHQLQDQPAPEPATAYDMLLAANVVPGGASAVVARTDLLRSVGGFDPALSTLADWDLWVRLAAVARLAIVDRPLVAYLVHGESMSTDTDLLAADLRAFLAKHAAARAARQVAFDEGNWRRYVAEMHLRAGRRLPAATEYALAARRGRVRAWRLAMASLAAPAWARRRLTARRRAHASPAWAAEAEGWLGPLRTAAGVPVAHDGDRAGSGSSGAPVAGTGGSAGPGGVGGGPGGGDPRPAVGGH